MSKFRIYELAKEFNTTSKVIIDILGRNNVTAKNHMSCVDEDAKAVIKRTFAHKGDVTDTNSANKQSSTPAMSGAQNQKPRDNQKNLNEQTDVRQVDPKGQYQQGQQRPQGQYQRGQQRPQGQYQRGQQRPQGQYQQGQQRPQGQYQQGQQ
ncbi:MAG: translation initiation factor IF-2 N-terminal domain-containing protein, partial [Negativicutes bacterium]